MTVSAHSYDCIIVGAGIGGLVCGCYLAKAGMKVLIAEQHSRPGGYCTSFRRKGFSFDAAAHSFGGGRTGGIMQRIFADLQISDRLQVSRHDPSDTILSPGHRLSFWADAGRTVQEFQETFPREARGISELFLFLQQPAPADIAALRKRTFQELLDRFVADRDLQAALALPVLGNGDLPPSLISAFSAAKIYTEFLLDGGYYPAAGMQALPDTLAARFREYGGELRLSSAVRHITVREQAVSGVVLENGECMSSIRVVSNCDALQTFTALLPPGTMSRGFADRLAAMTPSLSIFVLYLGIDGPFSGLPSAGSNLWFTPHTDIEALYRDADEMSSDSLAGHYLARVSPDQRTVLAFVNAACKNRQYWVDRKERFSAQLLERIETTAIPGLTGHVVFQEAATPHTMQRYTRNQAGAAYGWAQTVEQFADPDFRRPPFIKGLHLAGHWTTFAQGLPGVAYIGHDTARYVLKSSGRQPG